MIRRYKDEICDNNMRIEYDRASVEDMIQELRCEIYWVTHTAVRRYAGTLMGTKLFPFSMQLLTYSNSMALEALTVAARIVV